MKKIFCTIIICLFGIMPVFAENFPPIKYKNLGIKSKIFYDETSDTWSKKSNKDNYFIKVKGFGDYFDYLKADKSFAFTTDCEYEFLNDGKFIGYSSRFMKFYDITYLGGLLLKRPLSQEEVEKMFPDWNVIALSQFSSKTNSYKIKKHLNDLKIILYNDTNKPFDGYSFTSGNSKFEQYDLRGFITVSKTGMIQFSKAGESNYSAPWYVLLVR